MRYAEENCYFAFFEKYLNPGNLFIFSTPPPNTDPAPVLEASRSLEERLQQLQSSAPHSEALVRELSRHWKKHLDCLEATGESNSSTARSVLMTGSVDGDVFGFVQGVEQWSSCRTME